MKISFYKYCLVIAANFSTGILTAQSVKSSSHTFKEIQRNQFTDNFTAREIKKKELQIVPSQIILLNNIANRQTKEEKTGKKFRR
jgi:hypothetical protein